MKTIASLYSLLIVGAIMVTTTFAIAQSKGNDVSRAQVRAEVTEAMAAIKSYSLQQREQAIAEAREAIDKLDAEIDRRETALRESWSTMSEEARTRAQDLLWELRRRRDALGEWYGAMRHGADNAWADIMNGFAAAYEDLHAAWENADRADTATQGN